MNVTQCPSCHAPFGKPHAHSCTAGRNGNGHTDTVQAAYRDSKNKNSFADGLEFQDFVVDAIARECGFLIQLYASKYYQIKRGESVQRCEIKLDNWCTRTHRLSIEVAEKTYASQADFMPSGIFSPTRPLFYVQGNRERFYLFATKDLAAYSRRPEVQYKEEATIRTFYIPEVDAEGLAIIVVTS